MSNKQAYAGLLKRLVARRGLFAAAEKMARIMDCRFTLNELGKQKAEEARGQGELINPDGPEAAEAISSLLKALEPFADAYRDAEPYRDFDGRDCREMCVINAVSLSDFEAAYAALNSDAPLTNLTSSIQVSEEMPPCRFCGSKCRVENFNSEHVEATLWICGNSEYFGGDCPNQTVYLYEHAWQAAMRSKDHSIAVDDVERVIAEAIASTSEGNRELDEYKQLYADALRDYVVTKGQLEAMQAAVTRAEVFIRNLATCDTMIMASTLIAEADALKAKLGK